MAQLTRGVAALEVESTERWSPTYDYYVHIDILKNADPAVARAINKHMIEQDAFDPRIIFNFPFDSTDEHDKKKIFRPTLAERRRLGGRLSNGYYELWKVRRNQFSITAFGKMISELKLPSGMCTVVRIVRMFAGEHKIDVFKTK